ncbi:MAG: hypothetical protein JWR36_2882 [Glaciihabitans sp.]|nr:hypothetical protein [Glaciihabitans sp.]
MASYYPKSRKPRRGLRFANRVIFLFAIGGFTAIAFRALLGVKPVEAPQSPAPVPVPLPALPVEKRRKSKARSLVGALTFLTATVTLSLLATSGSYALWNGKTVINGSSLDTGNISLTVNTVTSYTLALPTTALAPGKSVLATATVKNAGSTPVSARVASTSIISNTNGLADSLTLTLTPVASAGACIAGLAGGTTAALASFNTAAAPYAMPAGASQLVCFELKLDSTAPSSVQGGSATFRLNLIADQTRP